MAVCPECESAVDVDDMDVEIGDELSCAECGTLLRVANDSPVELESVDEEDDEDDLADEEDEDEDEDDEGEEDAIWDDDPKED